MKKRVTGIGGFFFKAKDKERLCAWYRDRLGLPMGPWGGCEFHWRDRDDPARTGYTVWGAFAADTDYFKPSKKPFMFNFRVDDLDAVLAALRSEGVKVDPRIEDSPLGRFGWIMDPEGNRVELWEPPRPRPKRAAPKTEKPAPAARKQARKGGPR
jgi:predicted enzyme related to lactoylglutathione lyase